MKRIFLALALLVLGAPAWALDYGPLKVQWAIITAANPAFTTAQKVAAVDALTIPITPPRCLIAPTAIVNAIQLADLAGLTQLQLTQFDTLIAGSSVDASQGSNVRAGIQALFAGKTTTLSNLGALVAGCDAAPTTTLWWSAPVSEGGGGLPNAPTLADAAAAGLS